MKRAIPGLILFGLLLVPGLAWVAGLGQSADENRALTEWPELDLESLRSAEAFDAAGQAVIDRLPLRKEAAQANSEVLLRALNESSDPRVVPGEDGWLFFNDAVEQRCLAEHSQRLSAIAERAQAVVTSTGRTLHVVVAPDKAAIYPDRLSEDTCAADNVPILQDAVELLPFVSYPAEGLSQVRGDGTIGYEPYFQWDTHWNQIGAAVGARSVVTALSDGLWDETAVELTGEGSREADLAAMLGIEWTEPSPELVVTRPGITSSTTKLENLSAIDGEPVASAGRSQYVSSGPAANLIPGNTLLLHDSFGWNLIPALHPYFASLQTVRYTPINAASAAVIEPADLIVLEIVQRDLYGSVVGARLDARFAEVLHAEMTDARWELSMVEGIQTVTADPAPQCSAWYLLTDRPDSEQSGYTVNGQLVVPRSNAIKNAEFSPTGVWGIEDATDEILASIEVVSVCDDDASAPTASG